MTVLSPREEALKRGRPPQTQSRTTQTPQFGPESSAKSKNPPGKPKKEPLRYPFDIISDTTDYLKI